LPFWGVELTLYGRETAVIGIACSVNGKRPPDWRIGQLDITANALVALATEFAKMSMSVSVESILAQLKWLWLVDRPRPLYDLQAYDDAVHGPWGSSILLFRRSARCGTAMPKRFP
jgi:hypothetical protein